jgi:hypothetical protein
MSAKYRATGRAFTQAIPTMSSHTMSGAAAARPTTSERVSVMSASGTPMRRSSARVASAVRGRTAALTSDCPARVAATRRTRLTPSAWSRRCARASIAAVSPYTSRFITA